MTVRGELYQRSPRQVAADGGFGSRDNLREAKKKGTTDVSFSKHKEISVLEMVKRTWIQKKLRNFRAGIEASISVLKRAFGNAEDALHLADAGWRSGQKAFQCSRKKRPVCKHLFLR